MVPMRQDSLGNYPLETLVPRRSQPHVSAELTLMRETRGQCISCPPVTLIAWPVM